MTRAVAAVAMLAGSGLYCAASVFLPKLISDGAFPWFFFSVTLVLSLIAGWGMSRSAGRNPNLDFGFYASLMFFIPGYGILGALFLYSYRLFVPHTIPVIEGDLERAQAEREFRREQMASGSVEEMIRQELEVQSYFDIIRGHNRILKKALIGKIINQWTPNSVKILKIALLDAEYDVRSYASTALSELENRMAKSIIEQKEDVRREPELSGLRLKLAKSHLNYADSGLLDRNSSEHYIRSAKSILDNAEEALTLDDRSRAQLLILRAYASRLEGDSLSEGRHYNEVLTIEPDNQEALIFRCSSQFSARQFDELRRTIDSLIAVVDKHHPVYQSAILWRNAARTAE